MRYVPVLASILAVASVALPTTARATQRPALNVAAAFDESMLNDAELSGVRGSHRPGMTFRSVAQLADNQARDDFRQLGGVANAAMDAWWSSTGLSLIAANLIAERR